MSKEKPKFRYLTLRITTDEPARVVEELQKLEKTSGRELRVLWGGVKSTYVDVAFVAQRGTSVTFEEIRGALYWVALWNIKFMINH